MNMRRLAYAVVGFGAAAAAIATVITQHTTWWQLIVFAAAPDLALLVGASSGLQRGQLHPRAVPLYNAVHRFWLPAALVVVAFVPGWFAWVAGGLAWIAHISFDRSLGFGLRTPEGFQRPGA